MRQSVLIYEAMGPALPPSAASFGVFFYEATRGKNEVLKRETHYYLSSLECGAEEHAERIREHWSVENTCHYTLDVTFGEDDCQVRDRSAAHNLSIMRELAAKVLRAHPAKKSMRAKRKLAALDPAFRFALLAMIPQCFRA